MDLNRRDFIARAALGMGALAASGVPELAADPCGIPIGLQLFTVSDHLEKDLGGHVQARCMKLVTGTWRSAGPSIFTERSPRNSNACSTTAASARSARISPRSNSKPNSQKSIADARECGITYIGLASLDDQDRKSLDAIKRDADWFNHVGEAVNKAGGHFFYHGHNFDYASVGGVIEYDELLRRTDPKLANFQLDCFWCVRAGKDPVDYFNRFPGRFLQLHIKDLKPGFPPSTGGDDRPGAFTEVGQGVIDWRRIFKAAPKGGLQHYYVEQDECDRDSLESAKMSYDYLHNLAV